MTERREEIRQYAIDQLTDLKDYYTGYGSDLHNEVFNTDYYIIGTYQATQWLSDDVFDIIGYIQQYENENFGEVTTDLTSPESIVNVYVYIIGEELFQELDYLASCYDRNIDSEDIQKIIDELEE